MGILRETDYGKNTNAEVELISKLKEFKFNVDMFLGIINENGDMLGISKNEEIVVMKEDFRWLWDNSSIYISDNDGITKIEYNEDYEVVYGDDYISFGEYAFHVL
ncbi:MAG: hypothetical protein ACRDD7_02745 [Peptostreptococcaceae bacterium]